MTDRYYVRPITLRQRTWAYEIVDRKTGKVCERCDTAPVADAVCDSLNAEESETRKPRIGW